MTYSIANQQTGTANRLKANRRSDCIPEGVMSGRKQGNESKRNGCYTKTMTEILSEVITIEHWYLNCIRDTEKKKKRE